MKAKKDEEEDVEEKAGDGKTVHPAPMGTGSLAGIHRQTKTFHWKDVCYDIKIKGNPRRLLDRVDGWVKPGTLTALMVLFSFVRLCLCLAHDVFVWAG